MSAVIIPRFGKKICFFVKEADSAAGEKRCKKAFLKVSILALMREKKEGKRMFGTRSGN